MLQKSNKNSRKRLFCSFQAGIREKQAKIIVVSTALSGHFAHNPWQCEASERTLKETILLFYGILYSRRETLSCQIHDFPGKHCLDAGMKTESLDDPGWIQKIS